MNKQILSMSQQEIDRLTIIEQIKSKRISQKDAARQLKLGTRQVRRLQKRYQAYGASGLISKRRGQSSNNQLSPACKQQAIELIKKRYADFGPTFAHEKLTEQHGLHLSVESLRQWMIEAGIWKGKKRKAMSVHPSRARRSCYGELVQIDGSPHDWFEGCVPQCCLLVFIDDATSRLMELHFTVVESTEAYFTATQNYLKRHGRPLSYYSDRHGIFRVNIPEAKEGTGKTQFGRAMRELDIQIICANSPQAKGRVERANGILQDRLIKEMRLRGISDIPTANAFLPEFIEDYNRRFAVEASNPTDAHRRAIPPEHVLDLILSHQYQRKLTKQLELSYQNIIYQIQQDTPSYTMRGARVTVVDKAGDVTLIYKGKILPYQTLNKHNQPASVIDSKQLASKDPQRHIPKPTMAHPWKRYPICSNRKRATHISL